MVVGKMPARFTQAKPASVINEGCLSGSGPTCRMDAYCLDHNVLDLPIIDKYCAESIVFRTGNSGKVVVNVTWPVLANLSSELLQFKGCQGSIVKIMKQNDTRFVYIYFELIFFALFQD